ncbi:SxtJ family membrane protein [Pelagibacteraceae bacterium]|nr:SxtJ family membrane protein [Pelagibacteraceae bacterium]
MKNSSKNFGILFFIIFFIYGLWPLLNQDAIRVWSLVIGLIFLILALLNSKILNPLSSLWIKFGELLGKIISPLVMAFIYFLIITPIAIIIRLSRKDLLKTKFNSSSSYWIKRLKNIGSMKKQF